MSLKKAAASKKRKDLLGDDDLPRHKKLQGVKFLVVPAEIVFEIAGYYCVDFKDVVRMIHTFKSFRVFLLDGAKSESDSIQEFGLGPILRFLKERPLTVAVGRPKVPLITETMPKCFIGILKNVVYSPYKWEAGDRNEFRLKNMSIEAFDHGPVDEIDIRYLERELVFSPWSSLYDLVRCVAEFKSDPLTPLIEAGCDPISLDVYAVCQLIPEGVLRKLKNLERLRIGDTYRTRLEVGHIERLSDLAIEGYTSNFYYAFACVDLTDERSSDGHKYRYPFERMSNLKSLSAHDFFFPVEWLATAPHSLRHLSISDSYGRLPQLLFVDLLKNLESISLRNIHGMHSTKDILKNLKNVKSLSVENLPLADKELMLLSNLESLSVNYTGGSFSNHDDPIIASRHRFTNKSLKSLTKLKRLHIESCRKITEESIKCLTELRHLRVLSCRNFEFTDEVKKSLGKLISADVRGCKVPVNIRDVINNFGRRIHGVDIQELETSEGIAL